MKIKFGLTALSVCLTGLLYGGTMHYPANSGRAVKDAAKGYWHPGDVCTA